MATPVFIPFKKEGYAHQKCYLAKTNGCSTKITGEHCISHNLLNKIEKQNKTIDVVGLSWLPKEQLTSIGKKNLVSNVLCEQHNSVLSPLDAAVGHLVEAIGAIDADLLSTAPSGLTFQVSGADVERWVLKTLFGLVHSGQIKTQSGTPFLLKPKCLELLCNPAVRWPLGWGLYVATPATKIFHSSSLELIPHHNSATNEMLSLGLKFNGIEMNFLMGRPDHTGVFGVHRPRQLIFKKGEIQSTISFDWHGRKAGKDVSYLHAGAYSGPAPDHVFEDK